MILLSQEPRRIYESPTDLRLDGLVPPDSTKTPDMRIWVLLMRAREHVGRTSKGSLTDLQDIVDTTGINLSLRSTRPDQLAVYFDKHSSLFTGDSTFLVAPGDLFFVGHDQPWHAEDVGVVEMVDGAHFIGIIGNPTTGRITRARYSRSLLASGPVVGYARPNYHGRAPTTLEAILPDQFWVYHYGLALTKHGLMSGPLSLTDFTNDYVVATRRAAFRYGLGTPPDGEVTGAILRAIEMPVNFDLTYPSLEPTFLQTQRMWLEKVRRTPIYVKDLRYGVRASDSVRHLQMRLIACSSPTVAHADLEVSGNYFRTTDTVFAEFMRYRAADDYSVALRKLFPRSQFRLIYRKDV